MRLIIFLSILHTTPYKKGVRSGRSFCMSKNKGGGVQAGRGGCSIERGVSKKTRGGGMPQTWGMDSS